MAGASSSVVIRAALLLLLAICLCLAALLLIDSVAEFDRSLFLNNSLLGPAVILQLFALGLFVLAWKLQLEMGAAHFTVAEATTHVGVTLMGKYLPGKVWGLLGRAYLLTRRGIGNGEATGLLIADQFLTFYSGLAIGLLALLAYFSWQLALVLLLPLLAGSVLVVFSYHGVMGWFLEKCRPLLVRLLSREFAPATIAVDRRLFGLALLIYLLHWLSIALVLYLLFYPSLAAAPLANLLLLEAAIPLAMLSGFLALWAPGGIGVREGIIVLVLALNLPLELAATIAIAYRLICVFNDLLTGVFAIAYVARHNPALLQE